MGFSSTPVQAPARDIRNTVGNIPVEWYQDFPHVGYDLEGKRIYKPIRSLDELDKFLDKMENPDYWRTVRDKMTGADVKLTDEQVELVQRLQRGQFGDVRFNPYEPAVDFFSHEVMIHPVTNRPADKRSFIPSLIEKEKVSKMVHAIKMGWIQPRKPKEDVPTFYDLWAQEDPNSVLGRHKMHVPAPKLRLPGHEESYNPPPEYLLSEEERLAWEQQEPAERKLNFVPQRFGCLRAVPAYPRFIHERFERCLDLYLCPRQRKMRVNVDPEDLIPKLPKPRDLQPFPTTQALVYRGHGSLVRCLSVSPSGQWLVSGERGTRDTGAVRSRARSGCRSSLLCLWALPGCCRGVTARPPKHQEPGDEPDSGAQPCRRKGGAPAAGGTPPGAAGKVSLERRAAEPAAAWEAGDWEQMPFNGTRAFYSARVSRLAAAGGLLGSRALHNSRIPGRGLGTRLTSGGKNSPSGRRGGAGGRRLKTLPVGGAVKSVAWNPNPAVCLVAVCVEQAVLLVNPCLGDKLLYGATDQLLDAYVPPEEERLQPVQWVAATAEEHARGVRLVVQHGKAVKQVTWHGKGDYFASVLPDNGHVQVLIHQASKRWSQSPFRKSKGQVQCVLFHPTRPFFLVATQRFVRVYNLLKQELTKKLMANCKWVSSLAIHPGGDNVICGSYDSKLTWFDMDLSTKPYKVLRHHRKALRAVAFHKHYPLFASGSDDGTVIVCHGMVYNDLLQNPLLVPVKVLKGHALTQDLGVLDVAFHPTQPWLFSAGADATVRLYT
ncbi:ribosome biogenesis protein BOP1 isoform X2 [Alligator sinensis]|uniref:Ribosome biogenesis protein BOP1 n=1 Tax=Alligator sinensis TaxID=38654 RepID=A0A3Q0HDH6_ALLSI|nr:ribosome biogenesis protein BOP1 isoform X2 [Alligator sinensis]